MINPATDGVFVNNNVQPQRIPDIFEPFGLAVGSFKFYTQNYLPNGTGIAPLLRWGVPISRRQKPISLRCGTQLLPPPKFLSGNRSIQDERAEHK